MCLPAGRQGIADSGMDPERVKRILAVREEQVKEMNSTAELIIELGEECTYRSTCPHQPCCTCGGAQVVHVPVAADCGPRAHALPRAGP